MRWLLAETGLEQVIYLTSLKSSDHKMAREDGRTPATGTVQFSLVHQVAIPLLADLLDATFSHRQDCWCYSKQASLGVHTFNS